MMTRCHAPPSAPWHCADLMLFFAEIGETAQTSPDISAALIRVRVQISLSRGRMSDAEARCALRVADALGSRDFAAAARAAAHFCLT